MLMENEISEFVDQEQTVPTNAIQLAEYTKKDVKARRIILDAVKDHVIPHLPWKKTVSL